MKASELIAKLSEVEPDEEIYYMDETYGPQPVEVVALSNKFEFGVPYTDPTVVRCIQ